MPFDILWLEGKKRTRGIEENLFLNFHNNSQRKYNVGFRSHNCLIASQTFATCVVVKKTKQKPVKLIN